MKEKKRETKVFVVSLFCCDAVLYVFNVDELERRVCLNLMIKGKTLIKSDSPVV